MKESVLKAKNGSNNNNFETNRDMEICSFVR